ncbi:MAG: hypothetical protein WBE76_00090 [Terracidiphilus sp.]
MAKVTLVFAVLLVALGLAGYMGTGSQHPTALIPLWIGLLLGIFGVLAISPSESRRKIFMHINVTIGLLALLATIVEIIRTLISSKPPDTAAMVSKLSLAALLLAYVAVCVRSFIAARRARQV